MAWTPTHSVINARAIAENLLAYFEANQAEALEWANGSPMKSFQRIENSVGNINLPVYPAIMFSDDADRVDYADELAVGAYELMFEVMVTHPNPNTATTLAIKYAMALASMIRNCPQATYTANSGALASGAVLSLLEIGFETIKTNDQHNDFLQQFQMKATYTLTASAL